MNVCLQVTAHVLARLRGRRAPARGGAAGGAGSDVAGEGHFEVLGRAGGRRDVVIVRGVDLRRVELRLVRERADVLIVAMGDILVEPEGDPGDRGDRDLASVCRQIEEPEVLAGPALLARQGGVSGHIGCNRLDAHLRFSSSKETGLLWIGRHVLVTPGFSSSPVLARTSTFFLIAPRMPTCGEGSKCCN